LGAHKGITGKTGANPARFRHCEEGASLRSRHSAFGPGKVKRPANSLPLSQETYPGRNFLSFCGEQKTCEPLRLRALSLVIVAP